MLLVVLLYALLASTFIFAKKAVSYAHPCFLIAFRMIIAGGILLCYERFFNKKKITIAPSDKLLFLAVSLFHIYIAYVFDFWSLQFIGALKSTIIFSATPFIAAILSYFLLKERLTYKKVIGVAIGLCGLVPMFSHSMAGDTSGTLTSFSLPELVLLGSVISGSYAWFLVKRLMDRGYALSVINGVAMLVGGVFSLVTSIFWEGISQPVYAWKPFLFWVFLLIIVANLIVYNLYGWLLRSYSITFLCFSGFLSPCFGALYEWLFMGGSLSWHHGVSLVLVTLGLYVFYRDELAIRA